jgi:23S rRNA A1618 N6-methylase RlmF
MVWPQFQGVHDENKWSWRARPAERERVSENVSRGQQAAEEVARRWIATMQSVADQIQRQQQTLQQMMQDQMSSYVQLLNNPPFYVSQQPEEEGQRATGQAFHRASEQWMQLAQQQAFQQVVKESLGAYTDLFNPANK